MERKILLKQNRALGIKEGFDPKPKYINEAQQYKSIKNNILLLLTILGICLVIRFSGDNSTHSIGNNSKQYYDVPSHSAATNLQLKLA